MLLKREGFPEEGELVQCLITKIQYNSVFATLTEYEKTGMIHISEISPGRIRNIRDFVVEGKIVICMVLKVNKERGYIDLSLRRVNESEKRKKSDEIKQEQKAEKLIETVAELLKKPVQDIYREISVPITKKYRYIHYAFEEVITNNLNLESLGIKKEITDPLTKIIKDKIRIKEIYIKGEIKISIYEQNGLNIIKKALMNAEKNKNIIRYLGGGKYSITFTASDYKIAEKEMKETIENLKRIIEGAKGEFEFKRLDKK
ncbi:MAG: S1 RNA-binding domain-containing protein [Candidatus Woesearchaeota archaeon]